MNNYFSRNDKRKSLYSDVLYYVREIHKPAGDICQLISDCDFCLEYDDLCFECPVKDICDASNELYDKLRKLKSLCYIHLEL